MAAPSFILFHTNNLSSPFPLSSPKRYINQTLNDSSFLNFKKQSPLPNLRVKNPRTKNPRSAPVVVFAAQSNFLKVVQTVWKVGKDGIEAGTNLVPDSVPRPIARIAMTVVVFAVSLFLLKSFLSTAFFALATMGLVYFTFIALNKDQGPKGGFLIEIFNDPKPNESMEKVKVTIFGSEVRRLVDEKKSWSMESCNLITH
ncbi:hypothetical protein SADUNF_Sadunf02G0199100 [Salix dunnii]|uniref:Uncharacterized protein n=1 Tax=Salix dunnii TaxID=1413687 RepID=A0A835TKD1_9ROSI|nr:hypothetical protein SADUNF_Sadunf02G0199100 [Salix dunnii]